MTIELVDAQTGEIVEAMTADEAERITNRIALKIGTLADTYEAVMPMIRDAITRRADKALGYASPGAYVSDRFGDALSRLGVELRRDVVRELTAAGMSSRAIAPVVGTSHQQVRRDRQVAPNVPPEPIAKITETTKTETYVDTNTGAVVASPSKITGIDGKIYTRPEPTPEGQKVMDGLLNDPDLKRREQARKFHQALRNSWALDPWTPEFVATIIDDADVVTIDHLILNLTSWRDRVKAARTTKLAAVRELRP